ncbi:hypothetical protein TRFO_32235 [Tritrichomonas foetus]|uniref:Uncharacterized protein n=1 Tax=Tritrichomonas foetus TaxID=1144522 RepID=A0A1J4JP82_9EUKA|nr:hypothetical protein TRFO_32235 [Tritrichomonas foetus]|eukprot:OHT00937.1 hypothetical protein TRFO_32235 [Tritrichomonas foetus]
MNYIDWNSHELARQIKALGFGQYAHEFIKNEICGIHLPLITEEHLIEMGVTRIGHRILLIRRFADIVNNRIPTQSAASTSSRFSSPSIDQKFSDSLAADDTGPSIISKRSELPKSPAKKVVEEQPKKFSRLQKNPPTDDDDASSQSSTSHRSSRSNRSASTAKSKSNPQFGATEVPSRGSRAMAATPSVDPQEIQEKDNRVICQFCGRKFQPDAAKRHIPVCGRINGRNPKK